jgi:hypothetical protein
VSLDTPPLLSVCIQFGTMRHSRLLCTPCPSQEPLISKELWLLSLDNGIINQDLSEVRLTMTGTPLLPGPLNWHSKEIHANTLSHENTPVYNYSQVHAFVPILNQTQVNSNISNSNPIPLGHSNLPLPLACLDHLLPQ